MRTAVRGAARHQSGTAHLVAPGYRGAVIVIMTRSSAPALRVAAGLVLLVVVAALLPAAAVSAAGPSSTSYRMQAGYDVSVYLNWKTRWVHVKTTIEIVNTSGALVDRLLLNSAAAKLGSLKQLKATVDGRKVNASLGGQTIAVPLGGSLAPGESATVWVAYRARLRTSRRGRDYYWAKINGVAQMYRFIPWLSRRIPFGSQGHGEPFLTPTSPTVRVKVNSSRKLGWAASGRRVARDGRKLTFVANDVRDFSLTASPRYKTVSGKSKDGQTTIFAHTRTIDGRRLVRLARVELARYEAKTGVDYPHKTYRIAETGGGLAMESPGLIWIPGTRNAADHPFLVSHETAHQWFYSSVGNDQSTDAFADEALADYFARKAHGSLRSSRCKTDRLDRDIRGYSSACYFEVIYVQGARFLDKLAKDFGRGKFNRAIKTYSTDYRLGIGSNAKLLEALRAEMGDGVLARFHKRFPSLY